jgi:hypothetical protein
MFWRICPMTDMFKDNRDCKTYQPILVKIVTDCAGTDECQDIEWIFLSRELTKEEEIRLSESNTPEEIRDLIYDIKEINEPIVYEFDFATY